MNSGGKTGRSVAVGGLRAALVPLLAFCALTGCLSGVLTEQGKTLRTPADPISVRNFTFTGRADGALDVVQLLTVKVVEELQNDSHLAGVIISSDPPPRGEGGIEVRGVFTAYERHNPVVHIVGTIFANILCCLLTRGRGPGVETPSNLMTAEVSIVDVRTRETLATATVSCSSVFGSPEDMTATLAERVKGFIVRYQKAVAADAK